MERAAKLPARAGPSFRPSKRLQLNVVAAAAPAKRSPPPSTNSKNGELVMRQLGKDVDVSSSSARISSSNGTSSSNGNGNGRPMASAASSTAAVSVDSLLNGSSNGNGAYSNGAGSTSTRSSSTSAPRQIPLAQGASPSLALSTIDMEPSPSSSSSFLPASSTAQGTAPSAPVMRSAAAYQQMAVAEEVGRERPSDADFKWAQDSYNAVQRTFDTWTFFTIFRSRLWLLEQKWSYVGGFSEEKKKDRSRSLAKYLLQSVLELGPTFIKIGQLSSTRSDLFPTEFTEELSKLQDRVPAFSSEKARAIIEQDLGRSVEVMFKSFDPRPIAAASLGQVHRATLHSGEQVVVKVQRPGLRTLFDIDLENLRILAEQLDKGDENNRDFRGIYKECAQVLYEEIDYIREGRNADRFRRNFADVPWVQVPIVYWEFTGSRVITLQYLPGVKITDKERLLGASLDLDVIARRSTEAYLIQILKHGFFHADPHPGNVAVDLKNGSLTFYDFGMMGEIIPDVRERLLDCFYAIYRKDTNALVNTLVELGVIKPTGGDLLSVKRSVGFFIENLARQTERQETLSKIGEDLFAIAVDQPFRFPATFTFVLRAFSTLEGIGKTLNPNYQFGAVATPYAQELLDLENTTKQRQLLLEQVQQQATAIGSAAANMPLRIERIDAMLQQLEAGDLKLRVRVLEAERSARRAGVMQAATMNSVGAMGLLNLGTMMALNGLTGPAQSCMAGAALFAFLVFRGFKRVERLDKFEKEIRGG